MTVNHVSEWTRDRTASAIGTSDRHSLRATTRGVDRCLGGIAYWPHPI